MGPQDDRHPVSDVPTLSPSRPTPSPICLAEVIRPSVSKLLDGALLIVINDPQRHTDTLAVLGALREMLRQLGRSCRWRILIACGTHRFEADRRHRFERMLADVGGPIESITWHDCRDESLVPAGPGGAWRVHPLWVQGDTPVLVIGSVEPHYFAGLTGAHKTATIGCAARDAIEANHAGAMSSEAQPFALVGNPVFDGVADMVADLHRLRPIEAVNLVQAGSTLLAAAAGEPLATLAALSPIVERMFCHTLDEPADALVLEVTGPLARSFYQADKALKNTEDAVRDGGLLILHAACPDGIGQDHFVDLLQAAATYEQAATIVADRGYRLGDHKAVRLRRLTDPSQRAVRIIAVTAGLTDDACAILGMTRADTVAAALAAAGVSSSRDRLFAVPDAGNTVVRLASRP